MALSLANKEKAIAIGIIHYCFKTTLVPEAKENIPFLWAYNELLSVIYREVYRLKCKMMRILP